MNGDFYTVHRPALGEAKKIDLAHSVAMTLVEDGKAHQAVFFLREEYRRIWIEYADCKSESIEEYKS